MFEFDFLSLLCDTNTLWNILMILGTNVEQDEMICCFKNDTSGRIRGWTFFSKKSFSSYSCSLDFFIKSDNGEVCCVRENQDAEIYFFCPALSCNNKGNLPLQNWLNIPLIAMVRVYELCSLSAVFSFIIIFQGN